MHARQPYYGMVSQAGLQAHSAAREQTPQRATAGAAGRGKTVEKCDALEVEDSGDIP
jgi:hypothetical protein